MPWYKKNNSEKELLFYEEQPLPYRLAFVCGILIIHLIVICFLLTKLFSLIASLGGYESISRLQEASKIKLMFLGLILLIGIGTLILPWLFWKTKMLTKIFSDRIKINILPFIKREIPINTIVDFYVTSFRPLKDFGGWGLRWRPKKGWAFIMGSNQGIQLILNNNSKILIGTQKPQEIEQILKPLTDLK